MFARKTKCIPNRFLMIDTEVRALQSIRPMPDNDARTCAIDAAVAQ
jgi:hypothetical protein